MNVVIGLARTGCASTLRHRNFSRPAFHESRFSTVLRGSTWLVLVLCFLFESRAADDMGGPQRAGSLPFRRAMVMSGMGPDGLLYLGVYDAAVDLGLAPDVLIAPSGGSLAAGMILALPDRAERNAFIASKAMHSMMLTIEVDHGDPNRILAKMPGWYLKSIGVYDSPPRVFGRALVTVPQQWDQDHVRQEFPLRAGGPRVIVIAACLERVPRLDHNGKVKRFTETWITDRETAALVRGATSSLACRYPRSSIAPGVRVIDNMSIGQAVRASLAEPHIFDPLRFGGNNYFGGIINLYPLELARSLADEVVMMRLKPSIAAFETMFRGEFHFSLNERQASVDSQPVAARIDLRDKEEALEGSSFWFHVKRVRRVADVQAVEHPECESDKVWIIPRRTVVDGVPEDYGEFVRRIHAHYEFGYRRAMLCLQSVATRRDSIESLPAPGRICD